MEDPVLGITLPRLAIAFAPALVVVAILFKWSVKPGTALLALGRMLAQLLLIGYVLVFLFNTDQSAVILGVLTVMLAAASWISLRPVQKKDASLYRSALIAIAISGLATLFLVTTLVLRLDPWFLPRYMIPLAGMIFAGSMNAVSIAAERFESESGSDRSVDGARRTALGAALIPTINGLMAVGLVSLPGMMTGQILAGASPLTAARYQIVVMCMLFGTSGISASIYLMLASRRSTR